MSTPNGTGDDGTDLAADSDSTVYDLDPQCTLDDIETGERYLATVNGVVEYGVFVDLSESVSGLVHVSNLVDSYDVGDDLVVELAEVREDGDMSFTEVQFTEYQTASVGHGPRVDAADLADHAGETAHVEGNVVQIKQTGGPTIFQIRTGSGVLPAAAFEEAGVRAYGEVVLDDVVRVTGTVESRNDHHQIEVDDLRVLAGQAREDAEVVDLDLVVVVAGLDGADDPDHVVEDHFAVGPDARLLERRRREDAGLGANLEDRRATGLFDLDHLSLDVASLSGLCREVGGSDTGPAPH